MTVLYFVLFLFFLLFFLLFAKLHVTFLYDTSAKVTLRYLFLRFDGMKLFQRFTTGAPVELTAETEKEATPVAEKKKVKKKGSFLGFCDFLARIAQIVSYAVKESIAKLYVRLKMLEVVIATDDAAKTALLYGGTIQAANILCELLRRFSHFRCHSENLVIAPDFTAEKSRFRIHLILSIRPIHVVRILLRSYIKLFERKDVPNARNTSETSH